MKYEIVPENVADILKCVTQILVDFAILHNDSAAPQDHCGKCQSRICDLCSRNLEHYKCATTSLKDGYDIDKINMMKFQEAGREVK